MNIFVFDLPLEVYKSKGGDVCHLLYDTDNTLAEVTGSRLLR